MAHKEDRGNRSGRTERDPGVVDTSSEGVEIQVRIMTFRDGKHIEVPDAVDQFGMLQGETFGVNHRGRWEIPDIVAKEEKRTLELFQKGNLNEPLILVYYLKKALAKQTKYAHAEEPPLLHTPFVKYSAVQDEDEMSDETEVKIVQSRKGRKVEEQGSRSDMKERDHKQKIADEIEAEYPGARDYNGDVHIYYIFDPDSKSRSQRESNALYHRVSFTRHPWEKNPTQLHEIRKKDSLDFNSF